jgi:carbonic anhydrase
MSNPLTPDRALTQLIRGNERFVAGWPDRPNQSARRRREVSETGQQPFAIILSCSDSRVPPEIIFDQGLGDLFVIRVAGNILSDEILGTIEYAVEHMQVSLVVVLGHDKCGAVTAAVEGVETRNHVQTLLEALRPAAVAAKAQGGDVISIAIDMNVQQAVAALQNSEPVLSSACAAGHVKILGARYNLDTGEVKISASA